MNTWAGWQLNQRKPRPAPIRAAQNTVNFLINPTSTGRIYAIRWTTTPPRGRPSATSGETISGTSMLLTRAEFETMTKDLLVRTRLTTQQVLAQAPATLDYAAVNTRLRTPLIKRDGRFVPATWDEAFAEIERRLRRL